MKRQIAKKSLAMNGQGSAGESSKIVIEAPTVREGAFYDPHLNADYGGPYFQHHHNKLIQLDVRDEKGILVAPWTYPAALRAGTVVLINASLHCFVITDKNMDPKVYQINAHSIQILATSDTVVPDPVRPDIPSEQVDKKNGAVAEVKGVSASAAAAFVNFTMAKRVRADEDNGTTNDTGEKKAKKGKKKETGASKVTGIVDVDMPEGL